MTRRPRWNYGVLEDVERMITLPDGVTVTLEPGATNHLLRIEWKYTLEGELEGDELATDPNALADYIAQCVDTLNMKMRAELEDAHVTPRPIPQTIQARNETP